MLKTHLDAQFLALVTPLKGLMERAATLESVLDHDLSRSGVELV